MCCQLQKELGLDLKRKRRSSTGHGFSDDDSDDQDRKGGEVKRLLKSGNAPAVSFLLLKAALLRYKEIYGHLVIMGKFIVPCDDQWPEEMWGIKLGALSQRARLMRGYQEHRVELVSTAPNTLAYSMYTCIHTYRCTCTCTV